MLGLSVCHPDERGKCWRYFEQKRYFSGCSEGGAQQSSHQHQLLQQLLCTRIYSFFQTARSLGQGLSHGDKFSPQDLKETATNVSLLFVDTTLLEIICWFAARYPIVMTNNHSKGLPTGPCLEEITGFLWVLSGSVFCKGFSSFIGCRKPQSWSYSTLLPSLISLLLM